MDRAKVQAQLTKIAEAKKTQIPVREKKGILNSSNVHPVGTFGKETFDNALKIGHGTWTLDNGRITVHSWSYGLPGLLIFGKEMDSGCLQAKMKNGGYAASGCQGLVMCLTKEMKEDDGYHGSAAYFVRYNGSTVDILDAIPYYKSTTPPRQLASAPAEVGSGAFYTLRMSVRDGSKIIVWLNDKKLIELTAERKLQGKCALLAANGSYLFEDAKVETIGTASTIEKGRHP
jgi:hypothetical protein